MLLVAVSRLALALACLLPFAHAHQRPDCSDAALAAAPACAQPMDDVVALTPGSLYAAKIGCHACDRVEREAQGKHRIVQADYALFLNVSLALDRRAVLLNGAPVYPHMATIPRPPPILAPQLRPAFSYANLSQALACPNPDCRQPIRQPLDDACAAWCNDLPLGAVTLDFLYTARPTDYDATHKDAAARYWEIALDAIGASNGYMDDPHAVFDDASQKMLRVIVAGVALETGARKGGHGAQSGDSLFGSVDEEETIYEYQIADVSLQPRAYRFPAKQPPTLWQRVRIFFGLDIWAHDGQLVFLSDEWGNWGKKGTLRNMFGDLVHWHFWFLFWIIVPSTIAGLIALYGLYRLVLLILQQRELARWDGMDAVWEQVRREGTVQEEENALLNGAYRDEPGEEGSAQPPYYTDEPQTMKPLPNKPLPEKPLPDVPLIDAE